MSDSNPSKGLPQEDFYAKENPMNEQQRKERIEQLDRAIDAVDEVMLMLWNRGEHDIKLTSRSVELTEERNRLLQVERQLQRPR
jgi:hypothetical protein